MALNPQNINMIKIQTGSNLAETFPYNSDWGFYMLSNKEDDRTEPFYIQS